MTNRAARGTKAEKLEQGSGIPECLEGPKNPKDPEDLASLHVLADPFARLTRTGADWPKRESTAPLTDNHECEVAQTCTENTETEQDGARVLA